jgi:hypothetical protein
MSDRPSSMCSVYTFTRKLSLHIENENPLHSVSFHRAGFSTKSGRISVYARGLW